MEMSHNGSVRYKLGWCDFHPDTPCIIHPITSGSPHLNDLTLIYAEAPDAF